MTKLELRFITAGIITLALIAGITIGFQNPNSALGSYQAGIQSVIATSSTVVVGPGNATTVFSANSVNICTSRIITTGSKDITLSFDTNITPAAGIGHLQLASTTVAYDSSIYGCGKISAYGYTSSSTLTESEFR